MRDYKKRISLFLTVIMLMLSFSSASAFAEVGQTADSNDTTVIHENVEALKQDSKAVSNLSDGKQDLQDNALTSQAVENKAAEDKADNAKLKTRAADRGNQQFNEDDFYISGVNFNGLTDSGKEKLKASNGTLVFPRIKTKHGNYVSRIGDNAFKNLAIKTVSFPSSITEIGPQAFYNNEISNLTLPDTITEIGYGAFSNNRIKKLKLSEKLKEILGFTFANNYLDEVVLPDGLVKINYNAFENNISTNSNGKLRLLVKNPNKLTIEPRDADKYEIVPQASNPNRYVAEDFVHETVWDKSLQKNVCKVTGLSNSGKTKLSKNLDLVIPNQIDGKDVEVIGKNAFLERDLSSTVKLTSVKLPNNLLKIEDSAFGGNALKSVALPSKLRTIEQNAFCYNDISTLLIPNSVKEIGMNAFGGNSLGEVEIDNYKGLVKLDFQAFDSNVKIKYLRVKESFDINIKADNGVSVTTSPAGKASAGESIKISYNITDSSKELMYIKVKSGEYSTVTVKDNTFTMPKKAVTIEVKLKDKYTHDKWCAEDFEFGYYELGNPDDDFYLYEYSVRGLSEKGKAKLSSLKNVVLPKQDAKGTSPVWVNEDAFKGLKMESVEIPGNYTHVQNNAFKGCGLKKVILHEGLIYANDSAFENNAINELSLPTTFKYASKAAFKGNNLKSLKLPEICETVGPESFMNNKLEKVELGSRVKRIYGKAFAGNKLKEVNIPKSIKNKENGLDGIYSDAFDDNPGVENVPKKGKSKVILWTPEKNNPNKIVNRGNYVVDPKMPESPAPGESKWTAEDFTFGTIKLKTADSGIVELYAVTGFSDIGIKKLKSEKDLVLPTVDTKGKKVEAVADKAFTASYGDKRLNTLKIPEGYVYIGGMAFAFNGCGGELVLPESVEYVGMAAFFRNEFTSLIVPSSLESIPTSMMRGNKLNKVVFKGNNLKSIDRLSFSENRLEEITIPDSVKKIGAQTFTTNNGSDKYKGKLIIRTVSGTNPNKLADAENYLIDPKNPGEEPHINYSKWETSDFEYKGTAVTGFSEQGILKNKKNKNLVVPDKTPKGEAVTEIGIDAFRNLNAGYDIESIKLPETVTEIGDYAFQFNDIRKVKMPRDLKKLGMGVFMMSNVKEIEWNEKIEYIDQACFYMCELGKLEVPASVETVMNASFRKCGLTEVTFAKGSKLKKIESLAFADNSLTDINLPEGIEFIGSQAFGDNGFKEINVPASLKKIEFQAFVNNPSKKNPVPVIIHTPGGKNLNGLTDDQGKSFVIDPKVKASESEKAALKAEIERAEKVDNNKLTKKFKPLFDETLKEGKSIYADENASQASVNGSIKEIKWVLNRARLNRLMYEKEALDARKDEFDAEKWANVEDAYKDADTNLFYVNISDAKLDHLINTLSIALKALDSSTDELQGATAYEGEFAIKKTHYIEPYTIKVKVWVKDGVIVHVINNGTITDDPNDDEEHNGGYFKRAIENLSKYKGKKVKDVLDSKLSKDVGIDAVSGATVSTDGIHEAIKNALSKVPKPDPGAEDSVKLDLNDPTVNKDTGIEISGDTLIYIKGKSKGAELRIRGLNFASDKGNISIKVDGKAISKGDAYSLREGSIIIGFNKSYLDSLSVGNHSILIATGKGDVKVKLAIRETGVSEDNPNAQIIPTRGKIAAKQLRYGSRPVRTGDESEVAPFILLMMLSVASLGTLLAIRRRNSI